MPVNKTNVGDLGPGLLAAEDMRLKQYFYVKMNSSGTIEPMDGGDIVGHMGILLNKPNTGEACIISKPGNTHSLVATDAIPLNALVSITLGTGRGFRATDGLLVVGRCTKAAAALGELAEVHCWEARLVADVSTQGNNA